MHIYPFGESSSIPPFDRRCPAAAGAMHAASALAHMLSWVAQGCGSHSFVGASSQCSLHAYIAALQDGDVTH